MGFFWAMSESNRRASTADLGPAPSSIAGIVFQQHTEQRTCHISKKDLNSKRQKT